MEWARQLEDRCASVHAIPLDPRTALARAAASFALGGCLNRTFYSSRRMREQVGRLSALPLAATVAYSCPMAQYAPPGVPLLVDMVDLDSEKWFQYAELRVGGLLYRTEGRRYRKLEAQVARRAACSLFTTAREESLLEAFVPGARTAVMENGVDAEYFDPQSCPRLPGLEKRRYLLFLGMMDYYPNADAVRSFAEQVFPSIREARPDVEFLIVGRDPAAGVRKLERIPGVTVTGAVPDVRPYLAASMAVVAPLRIARGVQNKVLEALAMGRPVLASEQVCATFGATAPRGVTACATPEDYARATPRSAAGVADWDPSIRHGAISRFCWSANLKRILAELEAAAPQPRLGKTASV